jgi:hypothetical protein
MRLRHATAPIAHREAVPDGTPAPMVPGPLGPGTILVTHRCR